MPHAENETYVLSRGCSASSRLNLQYLLWKGLFDTSSGLHPSIDGICHASDTSGDKQAILFADVATGTSILLLDLASHVSDNVQLHGFDISPDQFPHESFLPSNVELFVSDATKEPAEAFRARYDAVHVRMMNAAIDGNDPGPVLRHANMLLKPGGVLQWDEINFWTMGKTVPAQGMATPCLDGLDNVFRHTKETTWISDLSQHFVKHGFNVIFDEDIKLETWKRHMLMEIWCLVTAEFADTLSSQGKVEQTAKVRKLADGAYDEIKQGAYFEHKIKVVVGKKNIRVD